MDRTTGALSRYVTSLRYETLPPGAVHAAKRHLIDSFGCAMGGYGSEPAVIARRVAPAWNGTPSARLLGEGRSTTLEAAAFANSVMIRFLDANDTYIATRLRPPERHAGRARRRGRRAGRVRDRTSCSRPWPATRCSARSPTRCPLRDRGWDQGVFVAPASAAGAGLLLGLSDGADGRRPRHRRHRRTWPPARPGPASWRCGRAARRPHPPRPGSSPPSSPRRA